MQKVILCKGLPASGKSFWSRQYCLDHPEFVRINKDDIRIELEDLPFSRKFEDEVLKLERERGVEILKSGKSLIVDDTNFAWKHENFWRNVIENSENSCIDFEIKWFDTPLEECIKRDSEREKSVGKSVILKMYESYVNPTKSK